MRVYVWAFFLNENKKNYYFLWALNKKKKVDMLQTCVSIAFSVFTFLFSFYKKYIIVDNIFTTNVLEINKSSNNHIVKNKICYQNLN